MSDRTLSTVKSNPPAARTSIWRLLAILAMLSFWTWNVPAQVSTGGLSGTVRDAQGSPIVGATVKIRDEDTGMLRRAITDSAGRYSIPSVSPGYYRVSVGQQGYRSAEIGRAHV